MRVAQTGKTKSIVEGLQRIVGFMNAVGSETTENQWGEYLNVFLKKNGPIMPFYSMATNIQTGRGRIVPELSLEAAQQLRWWMHNDLGFVRAEEPMAMPFEALVERLNELKLELVWQCDAAPESFKRFDPSQVIVKIRRDDGTIERWATISWPLTKTPKDHFYAILGKALETGDLTRLKVCRHCGQYLLAVKDRKRAFCPGGKCKDAFHAQERGEDGYYVRRREKQRKAAVKRAGQLGALGRARKVPHRILFEQIKQDTALPPRVVKQILDGDLSPNSQRPPKTDKPFKRRTALDPTFVSIPLTREQLETIIAEEAHRDKVYMQGIRAARKPSKPKPA